MMSREARIKILCVDDQAANLLALRAALSGFDYEIVEATSGDMALAKVQVDDYAVILLDVQMPVLDGFQTALRIRQMKRSSRTPIIFITANYPSEGYAKRGYEVGAVDYLFKPINSEILRAKIAIFADLYRAREEIKEKAQLLREIESKAKEVEIAELRKKSERKYQDLVEGIHNGIVWSMSLKNYRFSYVSGRAEEITGYPLKMWHEEPDFWVRRLPVEDRGRVQGMVEKAIENDQRVALEHRFKKLTGELIWFRTEFHLQQSTESGETELRGMSVDVTPLKETENALRAALKIRDDFLSIASHELKTPITPLQLQMQGFMRLIERGGFQNVSIEKLHGMLQISDAQVTRLARLIGQLLDVSRLSGGKLALHVEQVNLSDLVRDVLLQLRHDLETAECVVQTRIDSEIMGHWDRIRIEQVLINLITNSTKYAAGMPIEINVSQSGSNAVIAVKDRGIGIEKIDQARIFEKFERAVPIKNFGGLGLGLYISRQIVELHGGSIGVSSEPDQGAIFEVELPVNQLRLTAN